jgi:hypothetical protein
VIEGDRPALVDALGLGRLDAGPLALPDDPKLNLGHHAQHGGLSRPRLMA